MEQPPIDALPILRALMQSTRLEDHHYFHAHFNIIHQNVRCIGTAPIHQLQQAAAAAAAGGSGAVGGTGGTFGISAGGGGGGADGGGACAVGSCVAATGGGRGGRRGVMAELNPTPTLFIFSGMRIKMALVDGKQHDCLQRKSRVATSSKTMDHND
jgi:hypothetical protein